MEENKTFEMAIKRLEEIVSVLSEEHLSLQQSLDFFKEASELAAYCNSELANAELIVEEYSKMIPGDLQ